MGCPNERTETVLKKMPLPITKDLGSPVLELINHYGPKVHSLED